MVQDGPGWSRMVRNPRDTETRSTAHPAARDSGARKAQHSEARWSSAAVAFAASKKRTSSPHRRQVLATMPSGL